MTASLAEAPPGWRTDIALRARQLAGATAAGALLGLLVGGVGGRLAMLLLARLNPAVAGVTSDDGFTIGQFSSATFNLLIVATLIGIVGAGVYVALRGLMIGPRWFRLLSISVGPAVVVGSQIVHSDGVDFTLLNPPWLGIALFVLIPGLYALFLAVLGERWLDEEGPFAQSRSTLAFTPLALWLPLLPVLLLLAAAYLALEAIRRTSGGRALLAHPAWLWVGRAALTVVFVLASVELVRKSSELL